MISCYYCGEKAPDTRRGKPCDRCGRRLPSASALIALGKEPKKDSLGGLVLWAWSFLVIGAASLLMERVLAGGNPVQVSAALATFHYTALTCRFTCACIGLALVGANIGNSRLQGALILAALGMVHALPFLTRHA